MLDTERQSSESLEAERQRPFKRRRPKAQMGTIIERSGSYYVRYYTRDSDGKPYQKTEFLHKHDHKHHSTKCHAVKNLRDDFMRKINSNVRPLQSVLVTDFWRDTYLPFVQESLRESTVDGYEQIWRCHLEQHFAGKILQEYQPYHRNEFLFSVKNMRNKDGSRKLSLRTLQHIRWLASGIFTLAQDKGLILTNPWQGKSKVFEDVDVPEKKEGYTLQEAVDIMAALKDRPECQLFMALACFAGLRQSEIRGLKWEDYRDGQLHLVRGFVRGKEGPLKSRTSKRSVPLIAPLIVTLEAWRKQSGEPTTGWVFPNETGKRPINLRDRARNVIIPTLKKASIRWRGYHAGRHAFGTYLTGLTGNALAAKEGLGHSTQIVTESFYVGVTDNTLINAVQKLSAAVEVVKPKRLTQ